MAAELTPILCFIHMRPRYKSLTFDVESDIHAPSHYKISSHKSTTNNHSVFIAVFFSAFKYIYYVIYISWLYPPTQVVCVFNHMTGICLTKGLPSIWDMAGQVLNIKISYRKGEVILRLERLGEFCYMQVCVLQLSIRSSVPRSSAITTLLPNILHISGPYRHSLYCAKRLDKIWSFSLFKYRRITHPSRLISAKFSVKCLYYAQASHYLARFQTYALTLELVY